MGVCHERRGKQNQITKTVFFLAVLHRNLAQSVQREFWGLGRQIPPDKGHCSAVFLLCSEGGGGLKPNLLPQPFLEHCVHALSAASSSPALNFSYTGGP